MGCAGIMRRGWRCRGWASEFQQQLSPTSRDDLLRKSFTSLETTDTGMVLH